MHVHRPGELQLGRAVVTIGAFDGVHRGHQTLIKAAGDRADRIGAPLVAYTFDPPPRAHFAGARILTPLPDKLRLLEGFGVDHAVVAPFDDAYAQQPPERFMAELAALGATEIWIGPGFRFGARRSGDVGLLGTGFDVHVLESVLCAAREPISSSRVRELLEAGAHERAGELLGRHVTSA